MVPSVVTHSAEPFNDIHEYQVMLGNPDISCCACDLVPKHELAANR